MNQSGTTRIDTAGQQFAFSQWWKRSGVMVDDQGKEKMGRPANDNGI
jgi:hypothetical protein